MNNQIGNKVDDSIHKIHESRSMLQDTLVAGLKLLGCNTTSSAIEKIEAD